MKSTHKNQIRRGNVAEVNDDLFSPHIGLDEVEPLTIEELVATYEARINSGWQTTKTCGQFVLSALEREGEILRQDHSRRI